MLGCFNSEDGKTRQQSIRNDQRQDRSRKTHEHRQTSELTFHKTDLSNRRRRCSLFWIQMNLLQRNDFLGLPIPALYEVSDETVKLALQREGRRRPQHTLCTVA